MPNTLRDLAEEQRDRAASLGAAAQEALAVADAQLGSAQSEREELTGELAELEARISANRRAMPLARMPSDAAALVEELRQLLIEKRAMRRRLLESEERVAAAGDELERATARLEAASTRSRAAEARLVEEQDRRQRLDAWSALVRGEPLASLPARAGQVTSASPPPPPPPDAEEDTTAADRETFLAARTRVESDVPEALRTRAQQRGANALRAVDRQRAALTQAKDLEGAHRIAEEGAAGRVVHRRTSFLQAESALGEFALRAEERYRLAVSLLARIVDSAELTDAERSQINSESLTVPGADAVQREEDRDSAREAALDRAADLDSRERQLKAADIDASVPDDAQYQTLRAELDGLEAALATAEAALDDTQRNALEAWEASVPPEIWDNLAGFEQARRILEQLQAIDTAALTAGLQTAETSLIEALEEEDRRRRALEFIESEASRRQSALAFLEKTVRRRVRSEIHGDR